VILGSCSAIFIPILAISPVSCIEGFQSQWYYSGEIMSDPLLAVNIEGAIDVLNIFILSEKRKRLNFSTYPSI